MLRGPSPCAGGGPLRRCRGPAVSRSTSAVRSAACARRPSRSLACAGWPGRPGRRTYPARRSIPRELDLLVTKKDPGDQEHRRTEQPPDQPARAVGPGAGRERGRQPGVPALAVRVGGHGSPLRGGCGRTGDADYAIGVHHTVPRPRGTDQQHPGATRVVISSVRQRRQDRRPTPGGGFAPATGHLRGAHRPGLCWSCCSASRGWSCTSWWPVRTPMAPSSPGWATWAAGTT